MAGISRPARGCPGGMSCPLAASQAFATKNRVMLRAGRQSHLCKCRSINKTGFMFINAGVS